MFPEAIPPGVIIFSALFSSKSPEAPVPLSELAGRPALPARSAAPVRTGSRRTAWGGRHHKPIPREYEATACGDRQCPWELRGSTPVRLD